MWFYKITYIISSFSLGSEASRAFIHIKEYLSIAIKRIAESKIAESKIQCQSEMKYRTAFHEYAYLMKWSALRNIMQKISLQ